MDQAEEKCHEDNLPMAAGAEHSDKSPGGDWSEFAPLASPPFDGQLGDRSAESEEAA